MFSRGSKNGQAGSGKDRTTYSFVGPEVVVTGNIASPGQLHIDGKVIGDVHCGSLSQGESGAIHGNILADDAQLAGLIDGAVSAGTLLLEPTARVTGDVLYETLTVSTGAQVDGRFQRRPGESSAARQTMALTGPGRTTVQSEPVALQATSLFAGASDEDEREAAE